jgi:hypothetical protein
LVLSLRRVSTGRPSLSLVYFAAHGEGNVKRPLLRLIDGCTYPDSATTIDRIPS